jgi:large conductance mechanosensitive channel
MLQEFKDFINRGNVVDLAVAVVLGAAFGLVINSFVNDILMQIIAGIFGQPNFDNISIHWGEFTGINPDNGRELYDGGVIYVGSFITSVINFISVAFGVFVAVKAYNKMKPPAAAEEDGPTEVDLLTEIRDSLRTRS